MLNRLGRLPRSLPRTRTLSTSTTTAAGSTKRLRSPIIIISSVLVTSALFAVQPCIRAESNQGYESQSQLHGGKEGTIKPSVFLWGRNSHNVAGPSVPDSETIKKPKLVTPLNGVVLRDLAVSETYGAAVDSKGDVLQWGTGFDATSLGPRTTFRSHDILRVACSPSKVFALSRAGQVFIFPSSFEAQQVTTATAGRSWYTLPWLFGPKDAGVDYEQLRTDVPLARGEKFISISTGDSHLLALTSSHRSFSTPLSLSANSHGQLGVRHCALLTLHSSSVSSGSQMVTLVPDPNINEARRDAPPPKLDPLLSPTGRGRAPEPWIVGRELSEEVVPVEVRKETRIGETEEAESELEKNIRFSTTLHEIPSLRGVRVSQLVAGAQHSIALTREGRVLGWGANSYGQLGLGASLAFPSIPTPTEIPLARVYAKATRMVCEKIAAGGNSTYFVVGREDIQTGRRYIDLLASGNGQFGGIGNGSWAHAAAPVKVKTVSGLQEWNDKTQEVEPIAIREITVGKAHIAVVLDNAVEQAGGIKFGRDVFVWGHNEHYQLGTGKRSNLSTPQHLPPLPYPGLTTALIPDELPASGTLSPMPHSRLQLAPEIKVQGKRVEETIVAGDGGSAVYWRILDP